MTERKHGRTHIIVLVENYWESLIQSVVWFLSLGAAMSYGVWLGSAAMQWIMGMIWVMALVAWANDETDKKRMTIDQARARLDEIEGGTEVNP